MEDGIASGGGDAGYSCTEELVTLTEESVTTEEGVPSPSKRLAYNKAIDSETLRVTFNGETYECTRADAGELWVYGGIGPDGPDFSEYPFAIVSVKAGDTVTLYTETAGTYSVKIEVSEEQVETTVCFEKARGYRCVETYSLLMDDSVTTTADGSGNNTGELPISSLDGTIKVTFNGAEYICSENEGEWGAPFAIDGYDWSEFPFCISVGRREMLINTQAPGTYQIKIESVVESIETSECFAKAVNKVVEIPEPTPSLSKVVLEFVESGDHEPSGDPTDYCLGDLVGDTSPTPPTVSDIWNNYMAVEYYVVYNNMLMPLTYISSSLAKFSAFEKVTVSGESYIRHHEITYTSSGNVNWHRYDIKIPASYQ